MLKEKNIIKVWKGKVILTAIEDLKGAIWRRRRSHKHKQNHITGLKTKPCHVGYRQQVFSFLNGLLIIEMTSKIRL